MTGRNTKYKGEKLTRTQSIKLTESQFSKWKSDKTLPDKVRNLIDGKEINMSDIDKRFCELFDLKTSNQISKNQLMENAIANVSQIKAFESLVTELTYYLFNENPNHPFIQKLPENTLNQIRKLKFNASQD